MHNNPPASWVARGRRQNVSEGVVYGMWESNRVGESSASHHIAKRHWVQLTTTMSQVQCGRAANPTDRWGKSFFFATSPKSSLWNSFLLLFIKTTCSDFQLLRQKTWRQADNDVKYNLQSRWCKLRSHPCCFKNTLWVLHSRPSREWIKLSYVTALGMT